MEIFIGLLVLLPLLLFIHLSRGSKENRRYYERRGIPYIGNRSYSIFLEAITGVNQIDGLMEWCNRMKSNKWKIAGAKEFGANVYFVTDPELIKQICIKDFPHFYNRREFDVPKEEILFTKMLFSLKGEQWKTFRSKISPALTASKIKKVYGLFEKSASLLVRHLEQHLEESRGGGGTTVEVDFNRPLHKFTVEVIATAVCGLKSEAFDHGTKGASVFEEMANRMLLNFGGVQILKLFIMLIFPGIANLLKLSLFDKGAQEYYQWAIKQVITQRESAVVEEKERKLEDFIQFMIDARESSPESGFSDDDIVANCVLFILAGSDTTQSTQMFLCYELAMNPEVQDRLRAEIEEAVEKDADEKEGIISYEMIHKMSYLDMVFNEGLRRYPVTTLIDRGCTIDYKLPQSDFVVKKGEGIIIPVVGLHWNEALFPNPLKFDPERFSEANVGSIPSGALMGFGAGPRSCIGSRFATTETKLVIANIIYNFKLEPSKNTPIPMEYQNHSILRSKTGMKLNITRIPR